MVECLSTKSVGSNGFDLHAVRTGETIKVQTALRAEKGMKRSAAGSKPARGTTLFWVLICG